MCCTLLVGCLRSYTAGREDKKDEKDEEKKDEKDEKDKKEIQTYMQMQSHRTTQGSTRS